MNENTIAKIVFARALKIHKALGPGLLENIYEECLFYEIKKSGLKIEKQKILPVIYDDQVLIMGYRVDLLIENKFIVEIKSVDFLNEVHLAQLLTYLKLSGYKLGMLINFNVRFFKMGVKRVINGDL